MRHTWLQWLTLEPSLHQQLLLVTVTSVYAASSASSVLLYCMQFEHAVLTPRIVKWVYNSTCIIGGTTHLVYCGLVKHPLTQLKLQVGLLSEWVGQA